jgi:hypothetical protein
MTPRWLPEPSEEEVYGTEHPGHEVLGRFEPQDAKRILARLEQEHIPFEIDAPGEVRPRPTYFLRRHYLFVYVRPEHKQKAEAIVLEDEKLRI